MTSTSSNRLPRAAVLAGIVSLVALMPLSAGAPETVPLEYYFPLAPMASCEPFGFDFDIWSGGTMYGSAKLFKDKDGNLLRTEYHFKTDDVFENHSTNAQIVGHANFRQAVDEATGENKFRGLLWHVVVPGVGNVLHDAGLQIATFDPLVVKVMKGTYQWNVGDFEELCAALY